MTSPQFWSEWPTPWTQAQCEQRYVEGPKISISKLSEWSEVPIGTLNRWSTQEQWKQRRTNYQERLTEQTREKTVAKVSDAISDELSQLTLEHLEAYRICRQIATIKASFVLKKLKKAAQDLEQIPSAVPHPEVPDNLAVEFREAVRDAEMAHSLYGLDMAMLNALSLVIDRSVRGERMAASLEYEDINRAIAAVERTGLRVVIPDHATLKKLYPGQTQQTELPQLEPNRSTNLQNL